MSVKERKYGAKDKIIPFDFSLYIYHFNAYNLLVY